LVLGLRAGFGGLTLFSLAGLLTSTTWLPAAIIHFGAVRLYFGFSVILFLAMTSFSLLGPDSLLLFISMAIVGVCYAVLVNNIWCSIDLYTSSSPVQRARRGFYYGLVSSAMTLAQAWMAAADGSAVQFLFGGYVSLLYALLGGSGLVFLVVLACMILWKPNLLPNLHVMPSVTTTVIAQTPTAAMVTATQPVLDLAATSTYGHSMLKSTTTTANAITSPSH
jgi:hypothetical protein